MREDKIDAADRSVKPGMLTAIYLVSVYFIIFPIFPAVLFMEYEPGDVPILIGSLCSDLFGDFL